MGDRLGLHRGVDADPLEALRFDRFGPLRRRDGLLQQELDAVLADPLAPANQRARVDRQRELQVVEAAEVLPIRVLDPARDHLLVGQVEGVLQVAEPDHQPDRDAGPAHVGVIELAEARLEHRPIQQAGEAHQRMAPIDLLVEAGAEQVVGFLRGRAWWGASESPDFNTWWLNSGNLQYLVAPKTPKLQQLAAFSDPTG